MLTFVVVVVVVAVFYFVLFFVAVVFCLFLFLPLVYTCPLGEKNGMPRFCFNRLLVVVLRQKSIYSETPL